MSLFTPAWKSENYSRAAKALNKITDDEMLFRVVIEGMEPRVRSNAVDKISDNKTLYRIVIEESANFLKERAVENITDENILLEIIKTPNGSFKGLRVYISGIKRKAMLRMTDERLLAEAVLCFEKSRLKEADYIDKINSDDVLYEVASKRFDPAVFKKIKSDEKQLELADMNPNYTSLIRNKYGAGWIKLLLNGKFDEKDSVKYAKQLIKKGCGEGVVLLSNYIKRHPEEFRGGADTAALDNIRGKYEGGDFWAQVGLLGFFPKKNQLEYSAELIQSGDLRGLDIILKDMEEDPQSVDSVNAAKKLIEIYKKARKKNNTELMKRIEALPAKEYGNHRDEYFSYCGYTDRVNKGVKFFFDPSKVES